MKREQIDILNSMIEKLSPENFKTDNYGSSEYHSYDALLTLAKTLRPCDYVGMTEYVCGFISARFSHFDSMADSVAEILETMRD